MNFTGFSVAALDYYDDLELDNTKTYWEANKHIYAESVRAPMTALTEELAADFGPAKLFRPHRDVRFSKDKSPMKTHQGAYVRVADGTGWYVSLSAAGVYAGAGFYSGESTALSYVRRRIDNDRSGAELQRVANKLEKAGFTRGGDRLKTSPRGYSIDHPRIELLRHKSLTFGVSYGFEDIIHTPQLVDQVRTDWQQLRPLTEWFARTVEG